MATCMVVDSGIHVANTRNVHATAMTLSPVPACSKIGLHMPTHVCSLV